MDSILLAKVTDDLKIKATALGVKLLEVGGYLDHVHLLLQISPNGKPSEIIGQLKGYTSRENPNLRWQIGYAVFSVDRDSLATIAQYIRDQKKHHQAMNYRGEMSELKKHSLAMGLSP